MGIESGPSEDHVKEAIQSIVSDRKAEMPERTGLKERVISFASEIYERYRSHLAKELGTSTRMEEHENEQIGKAAQEHFHTRGREYLQNRLEQSTTLAFWYCLSTALKDKLTALVRETPTDEQATAAFASLVKAYLDRVACQNREADCFNNPNLPTIGIEAEFVAYDRPLHDLAMKRQRHGFIASEDYMPTGDKPALLHGALRKVPYWTKRENSPSATVGELAFTPSGSPTTQMREFLQLLKAGFLPESVSMQINVGGVKLDKDNPEPMILTSLLSGAQYVQTLPEDITLTRPPRVYETMAKRSDDAQVYPFHRARRPGYKLEGKPIPSDVSVEFRGNTEFDSFPNIARHTETTFWLSAAIMAHQRVKADPTIADPKVCALSKVWEQTELEWGKLLAKKQIDLKIKESVDESTRFFEYRDRKDNTVNLVLHAKTLSTPYSQALGEIYYYSHIDPSFKASAREILIKARTKVRELTGE